MQLLVLNLPDPWLARLFRLLEKLVYLFTGSRAAADAVAELADIFESGPAFTTTVRKLVAGAEPEIVESAVLCLRRPSPFGDA